LALSAALCAFAAVNPGGIFDATEFRGAKIRLRLKVAALAQHRPIYPAPAILLIWNFAPGSATPLQYHLQNVFGASDAEWGLWNSVFTASFIPTFISYGYLSARFSFQHLLRWATLIAVPQFVPLLFVHTLNEAMAAAALMGLLGGMASAAYLDLIIRSCPPALEGATVMMAGSLYFVSTRLGDVFGSLHLRKIRRLSCLRQSDDRALSVHFPCTAVCTRKRIAAHAINMRTVSLSSSR
jgi:hypothetical protein